MSATETQQGSVMDAKPQAEHRWLRKLVGQWKTESEASATGMPTERMIGTETVREFGDFWILTEGKGDVGGQAAYANRMTLGFDTHRRRFAGTFIDSSMAFLWVYDGRLEGDVLTLESEGPAFDGSPGMGKYRDIIQFLSDDDRVLRSDVLGPDGEWREFMVMHYRRVR